MCWSGRSAGSAVSRRKSPTTASDGWCGTCWGWRAPWSSTLRGGSPASGSLRPMAWRAACYRPSRRLSARSTPPLLWAKLRYIDFLDELTGRGMRDFLWLSYWPTPGDRALVKPYGALYGVYDMYTDIWPDGPRKARGWSPDLALFDAPGHMKVGYRG